MKWAQAILLLLVLIVTGTCRSQPALNILLITMDTTRADHLGCYGYEAISTPNIDRIAQEGTVYDRCYTPVPITLPAHTSIMTGTYPNYHGVHENNGFYVAAQLETLAEVLADNGYDTAAFVAAFPLDSQTGIDQGFQHYDDSYPSSLEEGKHPLLRGFYDERSAPDVVSPALNWLNQRDRRRPFFAWTHFFDPHQPYNPPSPYREIYQNQPYDGEIALMDEAIGQLVQQLKQQGLWENTLVVMMADHGEGLGDHGELTHALLLYSSTVRVPLIVRDPRQNKAKRVTKPVCSVDVMPTVLERLGIRVPDAVQGLMLPTTDDDYVAGRSIPTESLYGAMMHGWSPIERLTEDDWMYLDAPSSKLYHTLTDPAEQSDLIKQEPQQSQAMQSRLKQSWSQYQGNIEAEEGVISPEKLARLASLGYVGNFGQSDVQRGVKKELTDPYHAINAFRELNEGKQLIEAGNSAMAVPVLLHAKELDKKDTYLLMFLAIAYQNLGQWEQFGSTLKELLDIAPDHVAAHLLTIDYLLQQGDSDGAINALKRSLELDPKNQATQLFLARFLEDSGQYQDARLVYEQLLESSPDQTVAANGYATLLYRLGEAQAADHQFSQLLIEQPYYAPALLNLAVIRHDQGDYVESNRLAQRALDLRPNYSLAWEVRAMNLDALNEAGSKHAWQMALKFARDAASVTRIKTNGIEGKTTGI